jgi:hypothetical protein
MPIRIRFRQNDADPTGFRIHNTDFKSDVCHVAEVPIPG